MNGTLAKKYLPGFLYQFLKAGWKRIKPTFFSLGDATVRGVKRRDSLVPARLNYNRATPLCHIMFTEGTDKALYSGVSRHNYTTFYYKLLKKLRNREFNFFELGIGTTNPDIPANMGTAGTPGASLRGWSKFFSKANIYGADIDRSILFQQERIATFFCDQTDPLSIKQLWSNKELNGDFQVIIDDGLHSFEANRIFLENSIEKLSRRGIYIIEDVATELLPAWKEYFLKTGLYQDFFISILQIPNEYNYWDNNLIVLERNA